jgi:uncharacterized protein
MAMPADVPLFPLPDHVLIPGLPAPFRIFEPRYRALARDLLEKAPEERWMAMPRLQPGWEADYAGSPRFAPIAAAAVARRIEPAGNGEFHILVEGISRCRLTEIGSPHPYRLARVEALDDRAGDAAAAAMQSLLDLLSGLGDRIDLDAHGLQRLLGAESTHPLLVDRLGALVLTAVDERQELLETLDFTARIAIVHRAVSQLAASRRPPGGRWKPSTN